MKRVKIAVIDSGIDINHRAFYGKSIKSVEIVSHNNKHEIRNSFYDANGHGTAITGIILSQCEEAEIVGIRVLNEQLKCKKKNLCKAIEFAMQQNVNIINLSLGMSEKYRFEELKNLCDTANKMGILIVAAHNNDGTTSYPAAYPNVYGIKSTNLLKKTDIICLNDKNNDFVANGRCQKVCWLDNTFKYECGSSYACAQFSGILARQLLIGRKLRFKKIKYSGDTNLKMSYLMKNKVNKYIIKAIYFPIENTNLENVLFKTDIQIVGLYDYRKFFMDTYDYYIENQIKQLKIFNNLSKALENANTLFIGDLSYLDEHAKDELLANVLMQCIRLNKNIVSIDYIPTEKYAYIYKIAHEKGIKIYSKYF